MGPIPYCALNGLLDASLPKGALNYWKAHFLTDLSDDAIDALVDCVRGVSVADEPDRDRALPRRGDPRRCQRHGVHAAHASGFNVVHRFAVERSGATPRRARPGAATPTRRCTPFLGTTRYMNYLDDDEAGRHRGDRVRTELRAAARAQDEVRSRERLPHERQHSASITRAQLVISALRCSERAGGAAVGPCAECEGP